MKKRLFFIAVQFSFSITLLAGTSGYDPIDSLQQVEPWNYFQDFETREPGAWASYPHWQDLAYDQNFRVNEMVPGDPNLSLVQKVTPYSSVDNYAGAQKLMDAYLVPETNLHFRYFLKTNLPVEYFKIRVAAGSYGALDVTLLQPETNKWIWVTVNYSDFIRQNPIIAGKQQVKIYALAFLAKIAKADPSMPIYLGLDDISFKTVRPVEFNFIEPAMYKLPEFKPYIPKKAFHEGDWFTLDGQWPMDASRVDMEICSFTNAAQIVIKKELVHKAGHWILNPIKLSIPIGLYKGKITAFKDNQKLSYSEFTLHIAPKNLKGEHPRLLYNAETKKILDQRFKEPQFQKVYDNIEKNAADQRAANPIDKLVFDLDQFPDEDWLPTWAAWGSHIYNTAAALRWNSMAYAFHGDTVAGKYAKDVLVRLSQWPNWTHPWQTKRGRFSEHRTGSWSHRVAEAYDLTYNLMNEEERKMVRLAILNNIIKGVHRMYVVDDNITAKTSNWIAMTVGGSLMNMAAIYGDGEETNNLEPYFSGAMLKFYTFLQKVTDTVDGSWGEGLGYNSYTFSNLSYSVPSLNNVFHIDVSPTLVHTYNQYIWGGMLDKKLWFEFGDSGGDMAPATNWAFLLSMQKEPRLSWYYHYLKKEESFEDVLFNTNAIQQKNPYKENPVKVFRKIGTTVFKSGWEDSGFTFVMRSGAFFNHQHLDQGSFWLADKGVNFIEERHLHNSDYYDDPIYQSHLIQPIAHSTILINNNPQSQRVGDDYEFAPGWDDHAFIADFADGKEFSFSRGDIGKLYWGKVKSLSRNVLYLKPRTLLMLDEVEPSKKDVDITLLYQTAHLADISAGQKISTITKQGQKLNILHLYPENVETKAVETPHYLKTLLNEKPLIKEGMLTLTSHTSGKSVVIANLLTTTSELESPSVSYRQGNGYIQGEASGKKFVFTTSPGDRYEVNEMKTDALCLSWNEEEILLARATFFRQETFGFQSAYPITLIRSGSQISYSHEHSDTIIFYSNHLPKELMLNGKPIKDFKYNKERNEIQIFLLKGDGILRL